MALIRSSKAAIGGLIPNSGDYLLRSNYQMTAGNSNSLSMVGAGANVIVWNVSEYSTFTSSDSSLTLYGSSDGLTWGSEVPSSASADVSSFKYVFGILTGPASLAIS